MIDELNKVNERFHEIKRLLMRNTLTTAEDLRELHSIRLRLEKIIFDKYADDLQKLNSGKVLRFRG